MKLDRFYETDINTSLRFPEDKDFFTFIQISCFGFDI